MLPQGRGDGVRPPACTPYKGVNTRYRSEAKRHLLLWYDSTDSYGKFDDQHKKRTQASRGQAQLGSAGRIGETIRGSGRSVAARATLSVAIGIWPRYRAGTSTKVCRRSRADVTLITICAVTLSRAPNLKVAAICTV
ncbi:unnamed protein product, partial [Iphiclides podalirius]